MHPSRGVSVLLLFLLFAASCAGPAKLARQSQRALEAGEIGRAYELARRAVDKDPESRAARSALSAAAAQRFDDGKARVFQLASVDTVAAARFALDLRDFRAEVARYHVELPADSGYFRREGAIIDAAAGMEYRQGETSLAARRPKEAYGHYRTAGTFVASYGDLEEKLRRAHELAITRVAVLPFANDVDVPGLSRTLCDAIYHQVLDRLTRDGFEFTELVSPDEVYATMTAKELEALPPEEIWRVADGIEADRVVSGRIHGLRTNTNTFSFQYPIYRKITERDTAGKAITRWVETRFDAIARERRVTVTWDMQVLDARTREPLATRTESFESVARVAWTDFRADGSCDDYRIVPPEREAGEDGRKIDARWKECFGNWTLPDMLEQARGNRRRPVYESRYRDEFRSDSRRHPVLCGELPGEDDMTVIALDGAWRPVLSTLKALDAKD